MSGHMRAAAGKAIEEKHLLISTPVDKLIMLTTAKRIQCSEGISVLKTVTPTLFPYVVPAKTQFKEPTREANLVSRPAQAASPRLCS